MRAAWGRSFPAQLLRACLGFSGRFYVQALGADGMVRYTASAPGFRSRTGNLLLTPSGVMLTPIAQGPPDEAQVLRKVAPDGTHRVAASLARDEPVYLVAWTAQLDPATLRAADITVQPLRAGLTLLIPLTNSHPETGSVPASVTIQGGAANGRVEFKPQTPGTTEIAVSTPDKFTTAANSTMVIVSVNK